MLSDASRFAITLSVANSNVQMLMHALCAFACDTCVLNKGNEGSRSLNQRTQIHSSLPVLCRQRVIRRSQVWIPKAIKRFSGYRKIQIPFPSSNSCKVPSGYVLTEAGMEPGVDAHNRGAEWSNNLESAEDKWRKGSYTIVGYILMMLVSAQGRPKNYLFLIYLSIVVFLCIYSHRLLSRALVTTSFLCIYCVLLWG